MTPQPFVYRCFLCRRFVQDSHDCIRTVYPPVWYQCQDCDTRYCADCPSCPGCGSEETKEV